MSLKSVTCKVGEASMDADRIVCVSIYLDARITADDARQIKRLIDQMDVKKPHALLVDLTQMHSIDSEARKILATPRHENDFHTRAVAIVVQSAVSRIIANFFLGSSKPTVPIKMFTSTQDARAFLLSHLSSDAGVATS